MRNIINDGVEASARKSQAFKQSPGRDLKNLKTCLRNPCRGLIPIIDSINLCGENKGTDQLRSYCTADLHLCFVYAKSRFSHDMAHIRTVPPHSRNRANITLRSTKPTSLVSEWVAVLLLMKL